MKSRQALVLENLALRHQIGVLRRSVKQPRLKPRDRGFWVLLSRIWGAWDKSLVLVKPETVIRWQRKGFRLYWRWKSRGPGRPKLSAEIRDLIRQMSQANPLWGAPRIHGELQKLGIEISQAAVSKYMVRRRKPPSQNWRTFLENHAKDIVSVDFFADPTATFRQVTGLGIEQVAISARSPWQSPYVERVIGSRTHLGLGKDCPETRPVESPHLGVIRAEPMVGGLHHRYFRPAA